jgi:hypothetical protein
MTLESICISLLFLLNEHRKLMTPLYIVCIENQRVQAYSSSISEETIRQKTICLLRQAG